MATQLRRSGLEELGDKPWGTHFCLFYESKEDLLDLLIPYFKAGLEAHEYCLCVASEPVVAEDAERALRKAEPDFERYLSEGQIEIISHLDWYLAGGRFDPLRVRQGWLNKLDQALAQGFAGMRFAANIFWLEKQDWQTFAEYEAKLDEVFGQSRILGVCAYALEQSSAPDMLDVVRHHQFTVVRRHGAWERLEGSELGRAQAEIRGLNADLEHQVEERTAQLAAANEQLTEEVAERKRSEEALRRSDEHLRLVVNTIPALVWSAQPDGTVDFINQRHQEFTGLSLDDVQGWRWIKAIHPEDRAGLVDQWRIALATGEPLETEARLRRAHGDYRWLVMRAVPLRDDSGKIVRWYGTQSDIEDRKQAVDALRQSESELREAQQVARIGNWHLDIGANTVRWSEALYRIFDVDKTAFGGVFESFLSRVHPDDRARVLQANAAARSSGQAFELEYRITTRNGHVKYIRVVGHARKDSGGVASALFGTAQDITERKQAEEALRRSEADYRALADNSVQGIAIYQDQKAVYANPAVSRILGYTVEEFKAMSVEQNIALTHPIDRPIAVERARKRMAGEELSPSVETRILRKDGSTGWVQAFNNTIEYHGQPAVLSTMIDITERKLAEEAIRRSERVLREAESLGHTGSWEQDLVTGEIFNTEENLRLFFSDDRSKGIPFEDYTQAVHPDDREYVMQRHAQLLAEGGPSDIEFRVVWPDGSVHMLFGRAAVVRDELGQAIRTYGTNLDITERKRAEEENKRQAARAETLARIAARLNKNLDLDAVIHAVCEEAINTFKVSQASMSLYDKRRDLLVYAGGVNIPPEHAATIEPITRTRFEELIRAMGPIMVVPDIQAVPNVPNVEFSSHLDVRTVVAAAMMRDQELIGALAVGVNGHVRQFTDDELNLLKAVCDQAAQAIANAQLLKAANEQQEQLRTLSAKVADAQEAERRAVARELHDEIGQQLYAVGANLEAIRISPDAATLAGRLADSAALVDDAIRQVRDLALELRPSMLDDFGLVPALTWLVERQAARSDFKVEFAAEPLDLRLEPALETTIYRIVQIALTNVARHAQARHVTITIRRQGSKLEILINDNGAGFDVAAALERAQHGATLGLLSMQERVRLAGGTLEINSAPGQGTQICAHIPIDQRGGR